MAWNLTPRNLSHLLGKTTAMSQAVPPSAPVLQTSTKRSPAALEREGPAIFHQKLVESREEIK